MTIKEIRSSTGLSQAEFSEKYGIPKRTLEDWEAGKRTPRDYVVAMLALMIKTESSITEEMPMTYKITVETNPHFEEEAEKIIREAFDKLTDVTIKTPVGDGKFRIDCPIAMVEVKKED